MNPMQEMIFTSEIALQAKIAMQAAERLESSDRIEVWGSIQSLLVASGNVSKILWPSKKKYMSRGSKLRNILEVSDDSILSSRRFRNHFEHYDERVEDWVNNQRSSVYVDLAMNPDLGGSMSTHRGYNSFNNTLVFRDEVLELDVLLYELEELLEKCERFGVI